MAAALLALPFHCLLNGSTCPRRIPRTADGKPNLTLPRPGRLTANRISQAYGNPK